MSDSVVDVAPDLVDLLSHTHIAERFAKDHADDLRYVAKWGKWMKYDGKAWREEETNLHFDLARRLCKAIVEEREELPDRTKKEVLSKPTIAAVCHIAASDRRIAATFDQWDQDPRLLNTPSGVVDLTTGQIRPHRVEDYMSKMTAAAPNGDCPRWRSFLSWFGCGDGKVEQFLKRYCGYSLTGLTDEQALLFLYGFGGNGKTVFLRTGAGVLGSYHTTASMDVFTATNLPRHETELARLHGARSVTATETEEGKRWDEQRIKTLTGGDPISARFMRQDFFEYLPQFKLIISGNHRPSLRTVDEAIRRRMNLLHCSAVVPKEQRDRQLVEKLKEEWGGILVWMIEGCLEWQREGLRSPPAVVVATEDYLETQDAMALWIEECCEQDVNKNALGKHLWASWKSWAQDGGEFIGKERDFRERLKRRFNSNKGRDGVVFYGLGLKGMSSHQGENPSEGGGFRHDSEIPL